MTRKTLELSLALFMLVIGVILTGVEPGMRFDSQGSVPAYLSYTRGHGQVDNNGMASHGSKVGDRRADFQEQPGERSASELKEQLADQAANSDCIVRREPGATYVIYINWDGFAYRYYETVLAGRGLPF